MLFTFLDAPNVISYIKTEEKVKYEDVTPIANAVSLAYS